MFESCLRNFMSGINRPNSDGSPDSFCLITLVVFLTNNVKKCAYPPKKTYSQEI